MKLKIWRLICKTPTVLHLRSTGSVSLLKINQLSKDYYNQNKNNEEFKQKMRNRAKAYYEKKKKSKELLIIPDF